MLTIVKHARFSIKYFLFNEHACVNPYSTVGDSDLSTTAEALKVLDSHGSDIFELVRHTFELVRHTLILWWMLQLSKHYSCLLCFLKLMCALLLMMCLFVQVAATCSLTRGTNYNAIIYMMKVGPLYNAMPFFAIVRSRYKKGSIILLYSFFICFMLGKTSTIKSL